MSYLPKLDKPQKIKLSDYDPSNTGKANEDACKAKLDALGAELSDLQEWLYAAQTHSVLIVLQGLDTSGKDGTISHTMSYLNPQGCDVASFKVPTPLEASHDFLWRVHQQAPARGMMTIFNRSHYEDVLATRVHNLIPKSVWKARYDQITEFESLLASSNKTIIIKFFLHISKSEQKERLLAREQDEEKAWKLSTGDWEERQFWDDYTAAYEDALGATGTKYAPWYIVSANHKWYRNYMIAQTLVDALRPYKDDWKRALKALGEERKAELEKMRASGGFSPETSDKNVAKTH